MLISRVYYSFQFTHLMKVCVALVLLVLVTRLTAHTYKCVFDDHNQDLRAAAANNVPEVAVVEAGMHYKGRLLVVPSTNAYGPIRIYLDYTALISATITPGANGANTTTTARLNFILNALLVTQSFYQNRLRVGQLSSITIPAACVDYTPTNPGGTIANSDLLIFATYLTDPTQGYGATGKSCDWYSGVNPLPDYTLQEGRPTIGRIIFNTYNLVDSEPSLTNRLFQSITTTSIHEVTHILGFDSTLYHTYLDPSTGYNYSYPILITASSDVNSQRPATNLLATPYVKAWAQSHYNCSTLTGMLLENQDGTGLGSGSHWERTAIYDELMTGTSFGATKGVFALTFALLKDTGWYLADDTFSETSNYGYQKGCSFVLDACFSNTSFPQFCNAANEANISTCQTTYYGKSLCQNGAAVMADYCGVYFPYFDCVDPASADSGYQSYTYEVYSTSSFCVKSTLGRVTLPSNMQSRCYPYVCGTSSIVFTIGSYFVTCLSTEEGVTKTLSSLTGSLTCPSFTQFCTVARKPCKNWCSQHGYCMGGVCNCNAGYFGSDCSISSCAAGQYYNPPTSSCVGACTSGYYQNDYSRTCQACQSPCNECSGTPTNCVNCISSSLAKYFYQGACYTACPSASYASGFLCIACDQATAFCLTCSGSATTCTSCMNSRYLSSGTCVTTCSNPLGLYDVVHMTCVSGCLSYLLQVSQNCVYCANGTYFYGGACGSNCSVSGGASAYYPDDSYHACMTCSTYCNTCDGPYPENCTSCVSSSGTPYLLLKMCWAICPKGFYPNPTSGKCEVCPVQLSCQSCKYNSGTSAAYCTSCIYGSFYYSGNSTCISTCNTNQYQNTWNNSCTNCDPSCVTCNGPSSYSCLSCPGVNNLLTNSTGGYCLATCPSTGYVQVGTTCQPCDSTCITCNGVSSNQCATCQSGYYLYNGYCRYICPSGTYPDSTSRQCLSCDSSCSYCFNGTAQSCTSCSGSLLLYNFTCGSTCPVGMTANQWNVCFELLSRFSFIAALCLMAML